MILSARAILRPFTRLTHPGARAGTGTRPRHARAIRSLIWGCVAFALATAVLSVVVETMLPQVRDPEYGYRLVRLRALQRAHPDRPLVLIAGTSRTQNAIDPAAMGFPDEPGAPLVFNFGLSGSRPPHLHLLFQRLRAEGVRPTAVVIEVLGPTLAFAGPCDELFRDEPARLTAADLRHLNPYLDDPAPLWRKWLGVRLNPWAAHQRVVVAQLMPDLLPWTLRLDHHWGMMDERGFNAYPAHVATPEYREKRRARMFATYGETLRALRISALAERSLRDLVSDLRAEGVAVAFYLAPESPVFRSWYSPQSRAELAAFTRKLSEELGAPVFGAPTDFVEEDFADGHHILRPAAARFSRVLADQHLKPWLASGGLKQ